MSEVLSQAEKVFLLGNEAIARGALEAGIAVATTYPGTPASEIGDTFAEIAKQAGIYFEYSTNEKVAVEVAAGAALSGLRSIVSFKGFGFNVACDSIFPLAYTGVKAGMVIVVADDPNCWSSAQSEQDSRLFSKIAHLPMLEPSDPQEAKDLTKAAFEISEKFSVPVILRTTTRVSHMRGIVKLGKIEKKEVKGQFIKDIAFKNYPPEIIRTHSNLHEKLLKIKEFNEKSKLNFIINKKSSSKIGAITSGASFNYLMEVLEELNIKIPVLKITMTYPFPDKLASNFIKNLKEVFIVEELEPFIEEEIEKIAKNVNPKIKIYGKNLLPFAGELKPEIVMKAVAKVMKKEIPKELIEVEDVESVEKRFPQLCPGCPHRATFWSIKMAVGEDKVFAGDIGCYMLGIFPPINQQDFFLSMGAGMSVSQGIERSTKQKPIVFIGDSTFFHAGIPGLINAVHNKSNLLVVILDNKTTAMTGHQPHPGVASTGMGEETKALDLEEVVKACGVDNVKVLNAFNLEEFIKTAKEFYGFNGVGVIIARGECRLQAVRNMVKKGIKIPKFEFVEQPGEKEAEKLRSFGCPAVRKDKNFYIDEDLCSGCGVCSQIFSGIKVKKWV
ncbi:MAG: indolepyruvate ferredoxin oxidoreductase subunit alpha [Candidatus Aenigmatarchaeota archaeon]